MVAHPSEFEGLEINNPKLYADSISPQESRLYPYYAGYSASFAESILRTLSLPDGAFVFDPWNGSGTTTIAAAKLGFQALGQDLNPVMVLVAKANLLPASEASSLLPLAHTIADSSKRHSDEELGIDPLSTWLYPSSASVLRALEREINRYFVSASSYTFLTEKISLDCISSLASFFYVALFRTARILLKNFVPSNPTWVKKPTCHSTRKRPSAESIYAIFLSQIEELSNRLVADLVTFDKHPLVSIALGNAESLSISNSSVDAIVTSPPYCTRIDYAVSTSIEHAVLRTQPKKFDSIRRSLMGTSTVPEKTMPLELAWGDACNRFLAGVFEHQSKASKTYYYKNHLQYFYSLHESICELRRVLRPGGKAVLVVQDSYYKELKNDIPLITTQMAEIAGLSLRLRKDFCSSKSMAILNGRTKKYRNNHHVTESVLCFVRD